MGNGERAPEASSPSRGVVGIDLGTTHTVVARAADRAAAASDPGSTLRRTADVFPIEQLVGPQSVEARELYASTLYAPLEAEAAVMPDVFGDAPWVTGDFAKRRGTEVPGRAVSSAKSWLCHPGVDRLAPILPWGADDETLPRISPVDASARLLAHVRRAWDSAHPEEPLFDQEIVLTVPASFDEGARELTVQAAERAGLEVRLLEEPLAAFYDYLSRTPDAELEALAKGAGGEALVLVVDVGGGTTDLSLLAIRTDPSKKERVAVERIAVGRHLLLGGDNMDLALAHAAEGRLLGSASAEPGSEVKRLESTRFAQLTSACRSAKERLLGSEPPPEFPIAIASSGARLVGGTLRTELGREEVERIVLDGFFPVVGNEERPSRTRSALVAFGLPYERDVAITRHIAEFVARHVTDRELAGHPGANRARVHALLLNGGVFRAERVRERLVEVFSAWDQVAPRVLPQPDPDLAVARGAVAYGLALRGLSLKVTAGAPRAYYIGVETGDAARRKAMCIVPRGAPEESVLVSTGNPGGGAEPNGADGLSLVVGRPVRFDLFVSSDAPTTEVPGELITLTDDAFERAPPLVARFPAGAREETLAVDLEAKLTSVGTLELACVERGGSARRFRLAFQLRFDEGDGSRSSPPRSGASPSRSDSLRGSVQPTRTSTASVHTRRFDEARDAIDRVFGKPRSDSTGREAKDLVRELERILGERSTWTTELARGVFDELTADRRMGARRRSSDHERAFWMLAGFCLRPGFGALGDEQRILRVAPLFADRLAFPDEPRSWPQFFIAWRRVAAGLDEETQVRIRDFVDPFLAPPEAGLKKPKKPKLEADFDMLDLAASLERVPAARRALLGGWIVERTWTERDPRLWAALGRLGARVPSYASAHHVVSVPTAERWLDHLMREKWESIPTAARAAVEMGRLTGDRVRDLGESVRKEVAKRLERLPCPATWAASLREVVEVTDDDRRAFFGDDLPVGLRLHA